MNAARGARHNLLLSQLSPEEWERWHPLLELAEMPRGLVLGEPGQLPAHVYFPTTAIVSLLQVTQTGASTELAMVGHESVIGIAAVMGGEHLNRRATVHRAGQGYRLGAQILKDEFNRAGMLMHLLLHHVQAQMAQTAQAAVCNRYHSLDQQLCRWLLRNMDRLDGSELDITQEMIAQMLGVRREGITESAGKLQAAGLIRYARGRIAILDRPALEARTCECYAVVQKEYERLLPRSTE